MDSLPLHDPGDDSAISHNWTGELDQDRAIRLFFRTCQPSEILDPRAFALVVLPEQCSCDVGHRLRSKLYRFDRNLVRNDSSR